MKRFLLTVLMVAGALCSLYAQAKPKQELKKNVLLSASNCLAYPGPGVYKLTPAPKGKHPFYLSHFGRHGSRYLINLRDYEYALDVLARGNLHGKLTPLGEDVLQRVKRVVNEANNRRGDLTRLGVQQCRDIARRMMTNYPEVFEGNAVVNARSTMVMRCALSMENTLLQMVALNPKLQIDHDASYVDLYYLNHSDRELTAEIRQPQVRQAYDDFCNKHFYWQRLVGLLFNDTAYVNHEVNGERLVYYLFRMAGSVQNTELRNQVTLYDIFTDKELYDNWLMENAYWFLSYSHSPITGGRQPFSQRFLLRRIIEQADSCIRLEHPGATLRFGHETSLMPLVCLMGIDGYDQPIDDLEQVAKKGWANYRIFPMGGNVQMVFYRSDRNDSDVLVKVLLNEREATLPIKSDCAPYYHWADVRAYYLEKLSSFKESGLK